MGPSENQDHVDFDSIVSAKQLKIIKAAIPYIPTSEQKFMSIFVKIRELTNTFQLFNRSDDELVSICSVPEESRNPSEMLNAIKNCCEDQEKERIDLIFNLVTATSLYNTYRKQNNDADTSSNNMDFMSIMKNMLSPEQQAIFETYSNTFSGSS